MDCILMRHGVAVDREEWDEPDEIRPLTEQGKKKVRQAATGLSVLGVLPTHLLSSPLIRAHETANLVRASLCPSLDIVVCKALAPEATVERLTAVLADFPSNALVFCVGHEPLLGECATYWLTGRRLKNCPIKKAGAILIHFERKAAAGKGLLSWGLQPAQLRLVGRVIVPRPGEVRNGRTSG